MTCRLIFFKQWLKKKEIYVFFFNLSKTLRKEPKHFDKSINGLKKIKKKNHTKIQDQPRNKKSS
jgi:hypothetical protein